MRTNSVENRYIHEIDAPKLQRESQVPRQGRPAENITSDFFKASGFETRFSTEAEDEGRVDIGNKPTIDAIVYEKGKPIMSLQITTSEFQGIREKKMTEMKKKPFVRLDEMLSNDTSIPKILIYLDAKNVKTFDQEPDFSQHPEIAIQILDSSILSLKFDLSQTKNPLEQNAVQKLIEMFELERKKYIH